MWDDNDILHVINSPITEETDLPLVPLAEYVLSKVEENFETWQNIPWMVDVDSGTSVTFGDALEKSKNVANALAKLGFKQGNILYFVTFEMAQLYVVEIAVWLLGGAVRGCYQREAPEVYARQITESKAKLVLVDSDTAPFIKTAISCLDWETQLLYVGPKEVENAIGYETLISDEDSSVLPDFIEIDPMEEVVVIPNTSGSTGLPKGVMHTHYSAVAQSEMMDKIDYMPWETSVMALMTNYAIGNFSLVILTLRKGVTLYNISKFSMDTYFDILLQHRPCGLMLYPFVASWLAKSRQLNELDLSFIKKIYIGAWVLDPTTADLLHQKLPHAKLHQIYGMTEGMQISATDLTGDRNSEETKALPIIENQGELYVSSGQLMPYVRAKVIDIHTGEPLPKGERGEILIKSPAIMKGYFINGEIQKLSTKWFHTGDLGFFDDEDNIYVIERLSFMFKYMSIFVSPSEIESVLSEHQDIQAVGVVGMPDPEVSSLARAFVVLRPGRQSTEDELCAFVAERLPEYKHLHGGVRFIKKLPLNRGGKLDRGQLKAMAIKED